MNEQGRQLVRYTPNQVVAYNLRRARLLRGWTQEETAARLQEHLGVRWSSASYSVAERSTDRPERIRNFTADEIVAFARTFRLPVTWFFFPPDVEPAASDLRIAPVEVDPEKALTPLQLIELILGDPETQALLGLRIDEALKDQPEGSAGPYLGLLNELVGILSRRAIQQQLGEVEQWVGRLRDLAVLLEAAGESTTGTIDREIDRAVADFYEDHVRRDREGREADAGSR